MAAGAGEYRGVRSESQGEPGEAGEPGVTGTGGAAGLLGGRNRRPGQCKSGSLPDGIIAVGGRGRSSVESFALTASFSFARLFFRRGHARALVHQPRRNALGHRTPSA